jgi:F-type H+-transporting ATPase subunit delta
MFHPGPWASAFVGASGASAEEGLELLKALIPAMERAAGFVRGTAGARKAVRLLREAALKMGFDPGDRGMESALRTVGLLIKKNRLKYGKLLIGEIEKILDQRRGMLNAVVETATPLDGEFQQALEELLKQRTGARGIRLTIIPAPELLAGCRLRMEGRSLDISLRGQLQKMAADLQAAGGFSW